MNKAHVLGIATSKSLDIKRLKGVLDQFDDSEDLHTWNLICKLCDGLEADTDHNKYESKWLSTNDKNEMPEDTVNVDTVLGVFENVGIQCRSCGKKETTYKLIATRSADEGMSAMCKCRHCHHEWLIKV